MPTPSHELNPPLDGEPTTDEAGTDGDLNPPMDDQPDSAPVAASGDYADLNPPMDDDEEAPTGDATDPENPGP